MGSQGLPEAGARDKWNLLPEVVSGSYSGGVSMLRWPLFMEPPRPASSPSCPHVCSRRKKGLALCFQVSVHNLCLLHLR